MKAMVLAAGLGTRLKPWTDFHPKALAKVGGITLLERQIRYLQKFDIFDVVVNVHHFAEQIFQAIEENEGWGSNISISHEVEKVLETGGGLKNAAALLQNSEDILLINVDILTDLDLQKLIDYHQSNRGIATIVISDRLTSRYFLFDEQSRLSGWTNTKTGEERIVRMVHPLYKKAFSGIHIIKRDIFPLLPSEEKFSIVEAYLKMAAENPIYGYDHSLGVFLDLGKPDNLILAEQLIQQL